MYGKLAASKMSDMRLPSSSLQCHASPLMQAHETFRLLLAVMR